MPIYVYACVYLQGYTHNNVMNQVDQIRVRVSICRADYLVYLSFINDIFATFCQNAQ